ncbi:hypothetical protein [uncultured Cohaesibacter sp.]|uniref:hypothetical protein n=1 Tax=uncultured Cohaesibacter sp. TaxID=1002546 RepID=UPI0029C7C93C|nr:hypothetical protein [uncultured Cohaesibacter sp.]
MKKLVLALSLIAVTAVASGAQAMTTNRINSQDLTASQVKELIQKQGSVILSTGAGQYDRYVANSAQCSFGADTMPAFVPTADSNAAFVGYTCFFDPDNS